MTGNSVIRLVRERRRPQMHRRVASNRLGTDVAGRRTGRRYGRIGVPVLCRQRFRPSKRSIVQSVRKTLPRRRRIQIEATLPTSAETILATILLCRIDDAAPVPAASSRRSTPGGGRPALAAGLSATSRSMHLHRSRPVVPAGVHRPSSRAGHRSAASPEPTVSPPAGAGAPRVGFSAGFRNHPAFGRE